MKKFAIALLVLALPHSAIADAPEPRIIPNTIDGGFMQLMGRFDAPGVILKRVTLPGGQGTNFVFSDGSRLIVHQEPGAPGNVAVHALIGHGRSGMTEAMARHSWALTFLPIGGTVSGTYAEIAQWLNSSGHTAELNFVPELRAFRFSGSSRPLDVGYQIALICGYARHPAGGEAVGTKVREFSATMGTQIETNAGLVFSRAAQRAISGLGARYSELPARSEISPEAGSQIDRMVEDSMSGPIDMAVVGNVDPDQVAQYVLSTCAASSQTRLPRQFQQLRTSFKPGTYTAEFAKVADDAPADLDGIFWSTSKYELSDSNRIAMEILADVLRVRLSLKLSTGQKRVVPIVGTSEGFTGERIGFFGAGVPGPAKANEVVIGELLAITKDAQLEGQVAAILKSRATSRDVIMHNSVKLAEALAEGLSQEEVVHRFTMADAEDIAQSTDHVRSAAAWLIASNDRALLEVIPKQ